MVSGRNMAIGNHVLRLVVSSESKKEPEIVQIQVLAVVELVVPEMIINYNFAIVTYLVQVGTDCL